MERTLSTLVYLLLCGMSNIVIGIRLDRWMCGSSRVSLALPVAAVFFFLISQEIYVFTRNSATPA